MYRAFDKVCIHKPNTSRPANSERYIICKGKRPQFEAIRDYLFKVNSRLNQLGFSQLGVTNSKIDVTEVGKGIISQKKSSEFLLFLALVVSS